ncbi:BRCA1-associated protein 2-domain-containing protein [Lipomyces orientalis]|uniref:BRCA1-associated protein 2-domain-containing protein n=1 Tax=Lipomyces orientalis TaxID=1233043 RepID=A0ACC3TPX5_9ASCO
MPFRFYIVFDLLPRSFVSDKWVNAVFESNDIFMSDCIGDGATAESFPSEVLSDTLVQQLSKVDKRLGRIEVLNVDLEGTDGGSSGPESEMSSAVATKVTRATIPSSPRARFLGNGVIHLYRDGEEETTDVVTHNQAGVENSQTPVLAILAVPGYMTASDLLGFVGKDCRQTISHLRMLRSSAPNRYMVLMKFREKSHADKFYQDYNCKMFNSMEPETCHVVYISSIRFHKSTFPEFPYLLDDEFTPLAEHQISTDKRRNRATSVAGPSVLVKPAPPPTRALRELPTCPVCLERMDSSVTGLLTIICQHTFHCQCLSKWGDNSCPVCRYSQKKDHQSQLSEPNQCSSCGAVQNLWICLICGNIGCGRYDEAHAFQHYMEFDHVYAMDLESQRVWDYAGDGYVHRLIQNQSDGKLVELPSLAASSADHTGGDSCDENSSGDYVPREKLDSIGMEYTYLLTSQLESQRAYFEDKIAEAADKASAALDKAENAERDAAEAQARLSRAKTENDELKGIVPYLEKEHEKLKRKSETLQAVSKKLEKEWREEKSMNESMLQKLEFLIQEKAQKEKEIEELKDQLRDVMLYLDAQQKFQGMEEEVQQGMVSVRESPKKKKGRGKK